MDFLTHLFLPLVLVAVFRPGLLDDPVVLPLGFFGVAPDFDKFVGSIGLFHSLLVLVPFAVVVLLTGRAGRQIGIDRSRTYALVAVALLGSHLILDFIDGGPVTLLSPVVTEGVGLEYPLRLLFGEERFRVRATNPVVRLRVAEPRNSVHPYTPLNSFGVTSALLFAAVYARRRLDGAE